MAGAGDVCVTPGAAWWADALVADRERHRDRVVPESLVFPANQPDKEIALQ